MAPLASVDGTMTGAARWADRAAGVAFVDSCLRGVGQICFMNNPITGALILVALFTYSAWLGVAVLVGVVAATVTAHLLGFSRALVRAGLYGLNGALVGAGFATFLVPAWSVVIFGYVIGAAACSALVTAAVATLLAGWCIPALTIPFNLVTLTWFSVAVALPRARPGPLLEPRDVGASVGALDTVDVGALVAAVFRGISQLFLADSAVAGVIVLVGMLVCSRIAAAVALVASVIGMATGVVLGGDEATVLHGLWGYNSYVAAVAIAGIFFVPAARSMVLGAVAAVTAAVLYAAMTVWFAPWGLPALTLPFCVATVTLMLLGGVAAKLRVVPLDAVTTPEQHRRL